MTEVLWGLTARMALAFDTICSNGLSEAKRIGWISAGKQQIKMVCRILLGKDVPEHMRMCWKW